MQGPTIEPTEDAEHMDDPLSRLESEHRDPSGARHRLDEQLWDLDRQLVMLMRTVAERVPAATEAFLEADTHRAESLRRADAELTQRCTELEEAGYILIATQSPVATDLRRTIAVLRSVNDVQRSGNLLSHVVESLSWIHPPSLSSELRDNIRQLGSVSAEMFGRAATAWEQHDLLAADELERRDDEVDLLQKELLSELYTGGQSIEESVSLGLIARYYERIADHAVDMTWHLSFYLTGTRRNDAD